MTFAQLTAAAVLFAGVLAWRVPTRRGIRVAIGLLAVTVVVMGVPFWGNDFGGAISAAPGFALLAWLLLGKELRWRTVWMLLGVLVASGVVVGLVDLLRPSDQRTHVGKFFEKAGTDFGERDARAAPQGVGEPLGAHALAAARLHRRGRAAARVPLVGAAAFARPAARAGHDRAGDRAGPRGRRRARLRVERLRHHDPGHDGGGVRERARDPAGAGRVHRRPGAARDRGRGDPRRARHRAVPAHRERRDPLVARARTPELPRPHGGDGGRPVHHPHRARHRRRPLGARSDRGRCRDRTHRGAHRGAVRGVRLRFPRPGRRPHRGRLRPRLQGPPRRAARGAGHHRHAQARRRGRGRGGAGRHARVQVGPHAHRRRDADRVGGQPRATCSTARRVAPSSSGWSPTCPSRSRSAPRRSASRSRR